MSTGITIRSNPDRTLDGFFQNLAEEFEDINFSLKNDGCDLSPYLYCPESFEEEEQMRESGASDEQIALTKVITSDDFHPIDEVLRMIQRALELAKSYDEDWFGCGKDAFLTDLSEIIEILAANADSGINVQFLRG